MACDIPNGILSTHDGDEVPSKDCSGRMETHVAYVLRVRKHVGETSDERVRQVVIEEQLHDSPQDTSFRSR